MPSSKSVRASVVSARFSRTCFVALALFPAAAASAQVVLSDTFDTAIPAAINPGVATLAGVQGYAGLGHPGNQFGGQFLRSPTGNLVTITLTNLPAHSSLSIGFLFAAIDSLDGTGTFPEGDFLRVNVDGAQIFRESFANATPTQIQSYIPAPGVELARRVDLGFSQGTYYYDSAYDMSLEPRFQNIPHTASTAVITFIIEGPGIQSLDDESWAMDNLTVTLGGACDADVNQDGVADQGDVDYLINVIAGGSNPTGIDPDFNRDGVGDQGDIDALINVIAGGVCP